MCVACLLYSHTETQMKISRFTANATPLQNVDWKIKENENIFSMDTFYQSRRKEKKRKIDVHYVGKYVLCMNIRQHIEAIYRYAHICTLYISVHNTVVCQTCTYIIQTTTHYTCINCTSKRNHTYTRRTPHTNMVPYNLHFSFQFYY